MLGNIFSDKEEQTIPELPVSFNLAPQKQLRINMHQENTLKSWRYYSHHIARFPLDLRAHAQRLFLSIDHNMDNRVSGSIQDLFIALGDNGNALRKKMLEIAKPKLEKNDLIYFEKWLSNGKRTEFSHKLGSVLDNGLPGTPQKLVTPSQTQEEAASNYDNVIDEARACLEYGQVEEAQKLLEDELQANSDNPDVAQELLNIYLYTRDSSSFQSTTEQLLAADVELSDSWKQAQDESKDW